MDQNNFNAKELSEDQVYSINKFSVTSDAWSYKTTRRG